jgi:hypothetical protein
VLSLKIDCYDKLRQRFFFVRFDILMAVTLKSRPAVFWHVILCSLMEVYRRFGGTCCISLQVLVFASYRFLGLLFGTEGGGSVFLRNVGKLPDYTP